MPPLPPPLQRNNVPPSSRNLFSFLKIITSTNEWIFQLIRKTLSFFVRKKWQAARCYLATGWELKSVTGRRIDEIEALSLYWPRRRKQITTNKEENQSTNKQPTQSDTHASAAATYINVRRQTVDKRHLFALLYSTYLRNKKRPRHLFSVKCLPKKEKSIQSFCRSHFSYCQRKTQRGERITKKRPFLLNSRITCVPHTPVKYNIRATGEPHSDPNACFLNFFLVYLLYTFKLKKKEKETKRFSYFFSIWQPG